MDIKIILEPDVSPDQFAELSSAGTPDDIDVDTERYRKFAAVGVTDLGIRPFDDPMDGLLMIGEWLVPAFA